MYVQYKQEDNILDIVDRIFNKVSCVYDGYKVSISMGISLSSDGDMHYYDMYKTYYHLSIYKDLNPYLSISSHFHLVLLILWC